MTLRQHLRDQRKQLTPQAVLDASSAVAQKIISLPEFIKAQHIAFYSSSENEIDPVEILKTAKKENKKMYFPVMKNSELIFCRVDEKTQYEKNQFHILEPIVLAENVVTPDQIDLFLVPLVAFDKQCHRIGRGAGFYDRALKNKKGIAVGLAYAFQQVDHVAVRPWDVAMDMIVTEKSIFRCSSL